MQFAVQTRGSYQAILEMARWAERKGLAAIALPDHYLPVFGDISRDDAHDHLIHLAALARETTTLELVCLVAAVGFRHPAVLYKMGVTLDEVSGGRFTLGIGAGWYDEEFERFGLDYPNERERLERRDEAMAYLAAAVKPGAAGFEGRHYRLSHFDPHPHPTRLRLAVGGVGKVKTPAVAGAYADEFNIYACAPDEFRVKAERAKEAAVQAGRDPDSILISSASPAVAAEERADYERLRDEMAGLVGVETGRLEGSYKKRRYPHGWGGQPAEMLAELGEAGCQRFYMQMFVGGPADYDTIYSAYRS